MKNNILKNKKSGFSLIELAMVLVIIGLLIAGIMGGSSLIQNAKLRSVISESRSYQTAVNSFYAKYASVPGDYSGIITDASGVATTIFGNGNGVIQSIVPVLGVDEDAVAWVQLAASGVTPKLVSVTPTSFGVTNLGVGTNNRVRSSNGGALILNSIRENGRSSNALILTAKPTGGGGGSGTQHVFDQDEINSGIAGTYNLLNPILKTEDARDIDAKMDDGTANTGKVIGLNAPSATVYVSPTAPGTACQQITTITAAATSTDPVYNTNYNAAAACGMAFLIEL